MENFNEESLKINLIKKYVRKFYNVDSLLNNWIKKKKIVKFFILKNKKKNQ